VITEFASRIFVAALLILGTVLVIRWALRLAEGILLPGSLIVAVIGLVVVAIWLIRRHRENHYM
jgi:hypothetical protein